MNVSVTQRQDRRAFEPVSTTFEDNGLFRNDVCKLRIELMPMISSNNRGDIVVKGIVNDGAEITVVFAGRRKRAFGPLRTRLRAAQMKHVNKLRDKGDLDHDAAAELVNIRVPIYAEGAWRSRFQVNSEGFETRVHQFIAAQWVIAEGQIKSRVYGSAPELSPNAKR